jgi:hypothetical protein
MATIRFPSPPRVYDNTWANQYTRLLEQQVELIWNAVQEINLNVAPSYSSASKALLPNRQGQVVFDTDLQKLCVNTGSGWETITSVP